MTGQCRHAQCCAAGGVGVTLRVRPLRLPYRQRLDANARVQHDAVGNVVYRHFGTDKVPWRTFEHHGHIGIALGVRRATRPASEQHDALRRVRTDNPRREGAGGLQRVGREVLRGRVA